MSLAGAEFLAAFDRLPMGAFVVRHGGRRWVAVRSALADGRAEKLVAEAAGGGGHVSMNLYRLASGARLSPCEVAEEEARAFVLGAAVVGAMAMRQ